MTRTTTAFVLTALCAAGTASAQTTTAPPPPPPTTQQQQPPPTGQKPTPPPETQKPKPAEPVPFPADAKLAFIDLQRVVEQSALGQAGREQLKKLSDKLAANLATRNKEIKALQDKIASQKSVASADVLNGWLRDWNRLQRQAQFDQETAQVEYQQTERQLLENFQVKVLPLIETIRAEKGLWLIFALGENSPIAAAHPGLDLTAELIKRLDTIK